MNLRNDWTREEIEALYDQPFLDLVFQAQTGTSPTFPSQHHSSQYFIVD